MANYATLKAAIAAVIKQNGNNEITGQLLQQQLLAIVNSLGAGYQFAGVATPATNPGTPDQKVFYLASLSGVYTNFGSVVVNAGEIAALMYSSEWTKVPIYLGDTSIEDTPIFFTNKKLPLSCIRVIKNTSNFNVYIPNVYCNIQSANNESILQIPAKWLTSNDNAVHFLYVANDATDAVLLGQGENPPSGYHYAGAIWPNGNISTIRGDVIFDDGQFDFVQNGIGIANRINNTNIDAQNSAFYFCDELQNKIRRKKINKICVDITQAGTFSVFKTKCINVPAANVTETLIQQFTVTCLGWNYLEFTTPFVLGDDEYIGFLAKTDTARIATVHVLDVNSVSRWWIPSLINAENPLIQDSKLALLNIGVFTVEEQHEPLMLAKRPGYWEMSISDYSAQSTSALAFGGFYYENKYQEQVRGKKIEYIKFLSAKPGIGHIFVATGVGDVSNFNYNVVETFDIPTAGEILYKLKTPITLAANEWIGFEFGDSLRYSTNSQLYINLPNFLYKLGNSFQTVAAYLNIRLYEADQINDSDLKLEKSLSTNYRYPKLNGKKLSLLGDSITTYRGYVPVELGTFYPTGNVTSVHQTWWQRIIDNAGMTLLKNESRGGSKITNVQSNYMPMCDEQRLTALADGSTNPDIIIMFGGINEIVGVGPYSQLGEYPTDWDNTASMDKSVLKQAFPYIIKRLLTLYSAKLFVCIPAQVRNIAPYTVGSGRGFSYNQLKEVIKYVCDVYGVTVIDLSTVGGIKYSGTVTTMIDHVHPNALGQEEIAKVVLDHINIDSY